MKVTKATTTFILHIFSTKYIIYWVINCSPVTAITVELDYGEKVQYIS